MTAVFDPLSMPHAEAREALATGAPVFLCVNPVEYHGPHLSLRNDALVARGLAAALHARLARRRPGWPLLVTADLEVGVEPVPGPGSRGTPLPEAAALVRAACRSLVGLGAKRVVLTTFHGSPFHSFALEAGAEELRAAGVPSVAPLNAVIAMFGKADAREFAHVFETIADAGERARVMGSLAFDLHAGFGETSLALALAPESVSPRHTELSWCPEVTRDAGLERVSRLAARAGRSAVAADLAMAAYYAGWLRLAPFPGYMSAPHLASAEAGRRLLEVMVDRLEGPVVEALEGRPSGIALPMAWARAATLEGRLLRWLPM